jgi:hypothetical protein
VKLTSPSSSTKDNAAETTTFSPICIHVPLINYQTISVALRPQAKYTECVTVTDRRNIVPTFADRGMSRGQCGGSPTVVNLSFIDGGRYFSFK